MFENSSKIQNKPKQNITNNSHNISKIKPSNDKSIESGLKNECNQNNPNNIQNIHKDEKADGQCKFKDLIKKFDKTNNSQNIPNKKNEPNKPFILKTKKIFDQNYSDNTHNIPKSDKIIGNYPLEKTNSDKIQLYDYPIKESSFDKDLGLNAKKILFLGNAQEDFINTIINMFRNIEYKDEFRHKIKSLRESYDISSFNKTENIRIIRIPFGKEINENFIKKIISKLSQVHLVCYTFDKSVVELNLKQKKEIEFYKYLINFLNLRDKLIFLCDSKEELKNEEINEFINRFNLGKMKLYMKKIII